MNYNIKYIDEKSGGMLCRATCDFIPRIGEKMRTEESFPGVTFVITDIIYEFKSGMSTQQEVTIYIKPM